jgi:hypothetical protein
MRERRRGNNTVVRCQRREVGMARCGKKKHSVLGVFNKKRVRERVREIMLLVL